MLIDRIHLLFILFTDGYATFKQLLIRKNLIAMLPFSCHMCLFKLMESSFEPPSYLSFFYLYYNLKHNCSPISRRHKQKENHPLRLNNIYSVNFNNKSLIVNTLRACCCPPSHRTITFSSKTFDWSINWSILELFRFVSISHYLLQHCNVIVRWEGGTWAQHIKYRHKPTKYNTNFMYWDLVQIWLTLT
jgi:hypothetical protein